MWFNVVGGVVVTAGAVLGALPTLVSTPPGLSASLSLINLFTPGHLEVDEAQLSWNKASSFKGLKLFACHQSTQHAPAGTEKAALFSSRGPLLLGAEQVTCNKGLWDIVTGREVIVVMSRPTVNTLDDPETGEMALKRWFSSDAKEPQSKHWTPKVLHGGRGEGDKGVQRDDASRLMKEGMEGSRGVQKEGTNSVMKEGVKNGAATKAVPPQRRQEAAVMRDIVLTGEAHLQSVRLLVTDGTLTLEEDASQILGPQLHLGAALGLSQVRQWGEEASEDMSWVEAGLQGAHAHSQPAFLRATSEHLSAQVRGWRQPHKDGVLLHEPAVATFDITPVSTRMLLGLINPFLSDALASPGGGQIYASLAPKDMMLPFDDAVMTIEPVEVTLGSGSLISQIASGLNIRAALSRAPGLKLSVARTTVCISGSTYRTRRGDMMVTPLRADSESESSREAGLQLLLWGSTDTETKELDMTLALPVTALRPLGIKRAPEGYMLPIHISGSTDAPSVSLAPAVRRIADLHLWQRYHDQTDQSSSSKQSTTDNSDRTPSSKDNNQEHFKADLIDQGLQEESSNQNKEKESDGGLHKERYLNMIPKWVRKVVKLGASLVIPSEETFIAVEERLKEDIAALPPPDGANVVKGVEC